MDEAESAQWTIQMESVFGLDLRAADKSAQGDLSQALIGEVATFHIAGNPQSLLRTTSAIAHAESAPVKVCALQSGTMVLSRNGEADIQLRPGEIAIYDTAVPYQLHFEGQWNCAVMTVAREQLSLPNRTLNNAFRQHFPTPGAGAVLTQLIETSIHDGIQGQESSQFLGHAAIDLLAGLVYEKATPYAPDEALRVAIYSYIRDNLGSAQLSVATVARAHRLSVRTLHRLFEGEEYGVAELIRNLRLEEVHRDLQDPRLKNLTVLAIGMRHGISSQAHLTRLFRAKYGVPPAVFRRDHLKGAA
ncbi:AraC family transcriptional regulator [Corynebacterium suranareeae]|uniref:AraC family transcriptional regulator n=1 Tax=Corynebacterium suranareeae TaxID=2506452 RepID=A0A160PRG4_9CORY|nr:helix-turn-helix domain-containing protein [Corynebacterium suranareeae]BAU96797.1 AraC family transcriptional regulator [Corynebacterium suranareeae]